MYAERGAVARLEEEVAGLLGKPAAAMFPSGVMAQQAALRVHCDRAGSLRVGIPQLSHLLLHEDDGPRLLHGFRFEHLSTGRALPTVEDLDRLGAGLAAVLLELPLRDAGCLLPEWDDLTALTTRARALGVAVHVDGARIWESQPFYDRPLDEIAGVADSIYVSFYKGLGGLAGACLAGDEDVVAEARRWRKRMGGTLFHLTPYAVAALAGLREHLPRMGEYVAWGRALAEHLVAAGIRVNPSPPQTNTFELFADGEADAINERAIALHGAHPDPAVWGLAHRRRPGVGDVRGRRARVRAAAGARGGQRLAERDRRGVRGDRAGRSRPWLSAAGATRSPRRPRGT